VGGGPPRVHRKGGILVLDDSTLDKPSARLIDLVTRHWSGKQHAVVRGINLTTLSWTDATAASNVMTAQLLQ
jgi:putative transposase